MKSKDCQSNPIARKTSLASTFTVAALLLALLVTPMAAGAAGIDSFTVFGSADAQAPSLSNEGDLVFRALVTDTSGISGATCTLSFPYNSGTYTSAATFVTAPFSTTQGYFDIHVTTLTGVLPPTTVTVVYIKNGSVQAANGLNFSVSKGDPPIAITSSLTPSRLDQAVTFTATLSALGPNVKPSGTVTFKFGGSTQANSSNITINASGVASFFAPVGTFTSTGSLAVTLDYSGDTTYNTLTGQTGTSALTQVLNKANSSTALTASPTSPSLFNQSVTFTATVTGTVGTPTGSVSFTGAVNQSNVSLVSGVATVTTSALLVGPNTIIATYNGDSKYVTSTNNLSQSVKARTTTTVTSSPNPSTFGQSVTFTATVTTSDTSSKPGGNVSFSIDGGAPQSVALDSNGVATLSISSLAASTTPHTIAVDYPGNAGFATSSGTLAGGQTVRFISSTAVISSPNPSTFGQAVTFTATVTGTSTTPAGSVTFKINGIDQTTATLNGSGVATFTTSSLAASSTPYTVTATYAPSSVYAPSTGTLTGGQKVLAVSTTTVTSSPNPSVFGQSVTLTTTITGSSGTPTGTVTFLVDSQSYLSPGLINGSAVATHALLLVGTHMVSVNYAGNSTYAGSTGTLTPVQTVNKADTTIALTSSNNPSLSSATAGYTDTVTFTATVSAAAPGAGTPTGSGSVIFTIDGSAQPAVTPVNGVAKFDYSTFSQGTHTVSAKYNGDANFNASPQSSTLNQVVNRLFVIQSETKWSDIVPPPTAVDTVQFFNLAEDVTLTIDVNDAVCDSLQIINNTIFFNTLLIPSSSKLTVKNSLQITGVIGLQIFQSVNGLLSCGSVVNQFGEGNFTGAGQLQLTDAGTLPSGSGFSSFPNLIINAPGKTVKLVQNTTVTSSLTVMAGTLDLNGFTLTAANLSDGGASTGNIDLSTKGMTLNGSAATTYSGNTTGLEKLTYSGTGSLTLTGNCVQSLGSVVNSGALYINGSHFGRVTVNGGILGGTGQIMYGVSYADMQGGALQPGSASATGSFKAEGIFTPNSALNIRLNSLTDYDQMVVDGVNNYIDLGGCTLNATLGTGTKLGDKFMILSATNSAEIKGTFKGLAENTVFTIGTRAFKINYTTTAVTLTQVAAPTSISVASSANPAVVGQSVNFTATVAAVTGLTPTDGTVTFTIDGAVQTPVALVNGKAVIQGNFTALKAGISISAKYNGDTKGEYQASTSSAISQKVNTAPTVVTLTSSANPTTVGVPVTYTATVSATGITPTGSVTFNIDGIDQTPFTLTNGKATTQITTTAAKIDGFSVVASFIDAKGDFGRSFYRIVQVVNPAPLTTTLTSSANPSVLGQEVTFTATVVSAFGTATGNVTFTIDNKAQAPVPLIDGKAEIKMTFNELRTGIAVSADFSGNANGGAVSSRATLTQDVNFFSKNIFAVTSGPGVVAQLNVYDAKTQNLLLSLKGSVSGGRTVAVGDVNGDGIPDVIIGSGPGGSTVNVINGKDGSALRTFTTFDSTVTGGVTVASGDVDGDGYDDIIVGAGPGLSAVGVYSGKDGSLLKAFTAFDTSFKGGVTVASVDLDGDGKAEIVVGVGSHVRIFNGDAGAMIFDILPFGSAASGVTVAAGNVNGTPTFISSTVGVKNVISGFTLKGNINDITPPDNLQLYSLAVGDGNGNGTSTIYVGSDQSVSFYDYDASRNKFKNTRANLLPFGDAYTAGIQVAAGSAPTLAMLSGPTASVNPAFVHQDVTFTAKASGGAQSYAWNFGDGTSGSGDSVTHKFPVGRFTVTLTTTGRGQTLTSSLVMSVIAATSGAAVLPVFEIDSDGDGISDAMAAELGVEGLKALKDSGGMIPGGTPATTGYKVSTTTAPKTTTSNDRKAAAAKVNKLTLTGTVDIPAGFVANGTIVVADVGGYAKKFVLGKTGKSAKLADKSSFAVAVKAKKGVVAAQTAKFTLVLVGVPDSAKTPVPYQLLIGNVIHQKL